MFFDVLPLPLYVVSLVNLGVANVTNSIGEQTLVQRRYPSEFQGRVGSIGFVVVQVGLLAGTLASAQLLLRFSPQVAMSVGMTGFILGAVLTLRGLRWVDMPVRVEAVATGEHDLAVSG